MRTFLAVEVGADAVARVEQLVRSLRRRVEAIAPAARVTWTRREGLHLTLHFLGDLEQPEVERVVAAFETPLATRAFDAAFAEAGAFPPHGAPRVIWAGFQESAAGQLRLLYDETARRLRAAGLTPDDKPFRPHVTLGRVRDAAGLDRRALLAAADTAALGTVHVTAVTFFESRLHPDGAEHIAILRSRLATS